MKAKKTIADEGVSSVGESVSTVDESLSPKNGGWLDGILACLMNTRLRRGGAFAVTIAVHIVLLFFTALALDVKANPLEMPANIFKLADIRETAPVQAPARAPAPPRPTPPPPPAPRPRRETPPPPKPVEPEAVPVPVPVKEPEPIAETLVEAEEPPVEEEPVAEIAEVTETEEYAEAEYYEEAEETEAEEAPAPVEVAAAPPAAAPPSNRPPVQTEETYLPQNQVSVMPFFNDRDIRSRLVYPPIALRSGLEGTVYLELYIDSDGNVRRVEILKEDPTGRGFGEAAANAFTGLRGKPAEANGKLVAVRYRYPVRFKMQN